MIDDVEQQLNQLKHRNKELCKYLNKLNKEFDAIIASKRWRVGNAIIRLGEIMIGRPKRRLSTDTMTDIFRDYRKNKTQGSTARKDEGLPSFIDGRQLEQWMRLLKNDFEQFLLSRRWKIGAFIDVALTIKFSKKTAKNRSEQMQSVFHSYEIWKREKAKQFFTSDLSDKDVERLYDWMNLLKREFSKLMASSRWRFGSAVGRSMDRVFRRSHVPLVTDHMRDIFSHFDSKLKGISGKPTGCAPWSYRISESELYQQVRWYNFQKPGRKAKVVFYTAIMGSYDPILLPETIVGDWDYVVFCDKEIPGEHIFDVRQPNFQHNDPAKIARYVKTNPHRFFPDYDYSIWVDSNILIRGSHLTSSVLDCRKREVPIMFNPHPDRSCVYDEIKMCIKRGKDDPAVMENQVARYKAEGFPEHYGMFETGIMIRRHNTPQIKAFDEAWWREIENGSRRDQLSVTYVIWKQNLPFEELQGMKNVRIHDGNDYCLFPHEGQWQSGIPPYRPPSFVWTKEKQVLNQSSQISDELLMERAVKYNCTKNDEQRKVAIYTAISNNYDVLKIPEVLCPNWDYICFTDRHDLRGEHPWKIRHFDYLHKDPTRTARYLKTHPHVYFSAYEYSIWIDAHILIKTDFLEAFTNAFMSDSGGFAAIPHPFKNCTYQEGELCIAEKKDDAGIITEQLRRYKQEGLPVDWGLIETQVLVRKHNDSQVRDVNVAWWNEIERGSKRDQLSLMYTLWKHSLEWKPMIPKGMSTRSHPGFGFFQHGLIQTRKDPRYSIPAFLPPDFVFDRQPFWAHTVSSKESDKLSHLASHRIDIIVCVHNAIEDVKRCLDSVLTDLLPAHRLIIVDDGSDPETQEYLQTITQGITNASILRHDIALGYTKSANAGMAASDAPFIILLNSDTIVCRHWSLKLLQTALSGHEIGVVGPMSNAASWQSLPLLRDPVKGGMAINDLPEGTDVADIDRLCEEYGWFHSFPRVPLVNGFCYGIKRDVIETIGFFDEEAFPVGYGEEDDFSMRALDAGFVHAIATHCYVYHAKSKSFGKGGRKKLAETGGQFLRVRHGALRIERAVATTQNNPLLMRIRTEVGMACGIKASEPRQSLLPLPPGADDPVIYSKPAYSLSGNVSLAEDWIP